MEVSEWAMWTGKSRRRDERTTIPTPARMPHWSSTHYSKEFLCLAFAGQPGSASLD
jgi:hypothetical protein